MNTIKDFDFMALGQAIKKAREDKGLTREQLAEILDLAPRHLQSIENEGQYPSFQLFVRLITMFDISSDQYIHSDKKTYKSTIRRQIDTALDTFNDSELMIIQGTINGICSAKEQTKE
ncbi:helix-turn-helix transcriptional regulator [Clostridioides difficile]|nr:helix-turn-helix transcriptional regulator [Clostridioides difficile]HBF8218523.1 helix-turn-helix transcriptional regulator [Clostridioides difficile]HBF8501504.1 helix-turn-helix transcriptional regulator [Clostridioides difficile]HBF8736096.1 helix-turn-helix transcriptional regulator [Clostridioides difficile]